MQVLSHTVAAGITTKMRLKALETNNASAAANFTSNMDKLFNCFNSRNFRNKPPMAHGHNYTFLASSGHVAFVQHAFVQIQNWQPSLFDWMIFRQMNKSVTCEPLN